MIGHMDIKALWEEYDSLHSRWQRNYAIAGPDKLSYTETGRLHHLERLFADAVRRDEK